MDHNYRAPAAAFTDRLHSDASAPQGRVEVAFGGTRDLTRARQIAEQMRRAGSRRLLLVHLRGSRSRTPVACLASAATQRSLRRTHMYWREAVPPRRREDALSGAGETAVERFLGVHGITEKKRMLPFLAVIDALTGELLVSWRGGKLHRLTSARLQEGLRDAQASLHVGSVDPVRLATMEAGLDAVTEGASLTAVNTAATRAAIAASASLAPGAAGAGAGAGAGADADGDVQMGNEADAGVIDLTADSADMIDLTADSGGEEEAGAGVGADMERARQEERRVRRAAARRRWRRRRGGLARPAAVVSRRPTAGKKRRRLDDEEGEVARARPAAVVTKVDGLLPSESEMAPFVASAAAPGAIVVLLCLRTKRVQYAFRSNATLRDLYRAASFASRLCHAGISGHPRARTQFQLLRSDRTALSLDMSLSLRTADVHRCALRVEAV